MLLSRSQINALFSATVARELYKSDAKQTGFGNEEGSLKT
jgi:hypothetical protein